MTPAQQKAEELIEKFKSEARADIYDEVFAAYDKKYGEGKRKFNKVSEFSHEYHAIKCAIRCVEEIMKTSEIAYYEYWQEVLNELKNKQ